MIGLEFSETITLGSVLLGAVATLAVVIGVLYGVKWKVAAEVEAANAAAWEATARRLEQEIDKLKAQVNTLRAKVSELESLPDMSLLMRELQEHEKQAGKRWDGTIEVLAEIRDSLVNLADRSLPN